MMQNQIRKLSIKKDLIKLEQRVAKLEEVKLYTEAFLIQYIFSESSVRKLIRVSKSYSKSKDLASELIKMLSKNKIDIKQNNLNVQILNKTDSFLYVKEPESRIINIDDVIRLFEQSNMNFDPSRLRQLFSSNSGNGDKTCREKRNQIVHTNTEITKSEYETYKKIFNDYFALVNNFYE